MPFEVTLPTGETLKGSATRTVYKGTYYAANARVSCGGNYSPSVLGADMDVTTHCSDGVHGEGAGAEGAGTIKLSDGKTATFRYGDAAKAR